MTAATLIQHLGLSEAVAQVLSKVASCPQCLTFWSVLAQIVKPLITELSHIRKLKELRELRS